ncbi:competence type IV pilus minor pilin ComGG [Neobacillus sp. WH10]|uniref:competence type IV pilus minor pilin ComGG n=1 Tax=Neobacillus sp. WH10 TaxID=3047873 RepID=UPI0024C1AAFC|nr:competence type IV pilus minor pilin ComGG [Neobacillus sp. WH10]WHY76114.1 competence type IV pilus minor pilin ComGG [Neobacillus sp. WH10]
MKNTEQGFTYPLVLCILILFLLFFSMHIEQLLTERKMAHETAAIFQQEYYFLSSVKKVEWLFQTEGNIPDKGTIVYRNGTMDYQTEPISGYVQKVNFTLSLNSGEAITGRGFFDTGSKKMVKWVELK